MSAEQQESSKRRQRQAGNSISHDIPFRELRFSSFKFDVAELAKSSRRDAKSPEFGYGALASIAQT